MDWRKHISSKPNVCHGRPCFTGTRVMVSVIFDCLAEDMTEAEILAEYPTLTPDSIKAAMAYAADLARDRVLEMPGTAA
jgi:uncharacterized protein (DUF433 family)